MESRCKAKESELERVVSEKLKIEHEINSIRISNTKNELEESLNEFLDTPKENVNRT